MVLSLNTMPAVASHGGLESSSHNQKIPIFDGENGYWWILCVAQFWNARRTPESQWLLEVEGGLTGRARTWFRLWHRHNPTATWMTFEIAFLHRYQPDFRPVLPEILQNEVSDLELEEWIQEEEERVQMESPVNVGDNQLQNADIQPEDIVEEKPAINPTAATMDQNTDLPTGAQVDLAMTLIQDDEHQSPVKIPTQNSESFINTENGFGDSFQPSIPIYQVPALMNLYRTFKDIDNVRKLNEQYSGIMTTGNGSFCCSYLFLTLVQSGKLEEILGNSWWFRIRNFEDMVIKMSPHSSFYFTVNLGTKSDDRMLGFGFDPGGEVGSSNKINRIQFTTNMFDEIPNTGLSQLLKSHNVQQIDKSNQQLDECNEKEAEMYLHWKNVIGKPELFSVYTSRAALNPNSLLNFYQCVCELPVQELAAGVTILLIADTSTNRPYLNQEKFKNNATIKACHVDIISFVALLQFVLAYRTKLVPVLWNVMKQCHEKNKRPSWSEWLYLSSDASNWLAPIAVFALDSSYICCRNGNTVDVCYRNRFTNASVSCATNQRLEFHNRKLAHLAVFLEVHGSIHSLNLLMTFDPGGAPLLINQTMPMCNAATEGIFYIMQFHVKNFLWDLHRWESRSVVKACLSRAPYYPYDKSAYSTIPVTTCLVQIIEIGPHRFKIIDFLFYSYVVHTTAAMESVATVTSSIPDLPQHHSSIMFIEEYLSFGGFLLRRILATLRTIILSTTMTTHIGLLATSTHLSCLMRIPSVFENKLKTMHPILEMFPGQMLKCLIIAIYDAKCKNVEAPFELYLEIGNYELIHLHGIGKSISDWISQLNSYQCVSGELSQVEILKATNLRIEATNLHIENAKTQCGSHIVLVGFILSFMVNDATPTVVMTIRVAIVNWVAFPYSYKSGQLFWCIVVGLWPEFIAGLVIKSCSIFTHHLVQSAVGFYMVCVTINVPSGLAWGHKFFSTQNFPAVAQIFVSIRLAAIIDIVGTELELPCMLAISISIDAMGPIYAKPKDVVELDEMPKGTKEGIHCLDTATDYNALDLEDKVHFNGGGIVMSKRSPNCPTHQLWPNNATEVFSTMSKPGKA